MKRIFAFMAALAMLLGLGGCSNANQSVVDQFVRGLNEYDRTVMAECLTEFPNNESYVYLDDIFNDAKYIELYQLLYGDISYKVKKTKGNKMTVEVTMPNVQKLYTETAAYVMNIAMSDKTLTDKLDENEENGIILMQEMMLAFARQENTVEEMVQDYELTFRESEGRMLIVCDDQLRAMMTGNFFLSKSTKQP